MCSYMELYAITVYLSVICCLSHGSESWTDSRLEAADVEAPVMFNRRIKREPSGKTTCGLSTGDSVEIDTEQEFKSNPWCYKLYCLGTRILPRPSGCLVGDKCVPRDSIYFMNGCRLYQCQKTKAYNLDSVLKEQLCTDHYGKCHQPGESYTFSINKVLYGDCTCNVENQKVESIRCFGDPI